MLRLSDELATSIAPFLKRAVEDKAIARLAAHDASLWDSADCAEVRDRLGWVQAPAVAQSLFTAIDEECVRATQSGLDRIVLCGMGGSSLAPEVITRAHNVELLILDSSHPQMVQQALTQLERSLFIISSKSGSTLETVSHLRQCLDALTQTGLAAARHLVVVTDPGSPMEAAVEPHGVRVFHGDPTIGGRYSAFSNFGLLPSALAGADIRTLIDEAADVQSVLNRPNEENPALLLAACLAYLGSQGLGVFTLSDGARWGFGAWVEQLVAESLGKQGVGPLPVVLNEAIEELGDNIVHVSLNGEPEHVHTHTIQIDAPLGAQFLLWEYATAIAGYLLKVDPFDQPDVESSKRSARAVLEEGVKARPADLVDGTTSVWGLAGHDLKSVLGSFVTSTSEDEYLALCLFLNRWEHADLESIPSDLMGLLGRPVTLGWGPRFLHSTGQFHKGGPAKGRFIFVAANDVNDFPVAGRDFTWGQILDSQLRGDSDILESLARPVLRVQLADTDESLRQFIDALGFKK